MTSHQLTLLVFVHKKKMNSTDEVESLKDQIDIINSHVLRLEGELFLSKKKIQNMDWDLKILEGNLTLKDKEICRLRESETKKKTMPCRFFNKKRGCKYGSMCRFSHEEPKLSRQKDEKLDLVQSSGVEGKLQAAGFSNIEVLKFLLSMDGDDKIANANFIPVKQLEQFLNEAEASVSNPSLASIGRNFCLQKHIDISSLPLIFQDFLNKGVSKKRSQ